MKAEGTRKKAKRYKHFSVYVKTARQLLHLTQAADRAGVSLSQYVLNAALKESQAPSAIR